MNLGFSRSPPHTLASCPNLIASPCPGVSAGLASPKVPRTFYHNPNGAQGMGVGCFPSSGCHCLALYSPLSPLNPTQRRQFSFKTDTSVGLRTLCPLGLYLAPGLILQSLELLLKEDPASSSHPPPLHLCSQENPGVPLTFYSPSLCCV